MYINKKLAFKTASLFVLFALMLSNNFAVAETENSSLSLEALYKSIQLERQSQKQADRKRELLFEERKLDLKEKLNNLRQELARKERELANYKSKVVTTSKQIEDSKQQLADRSHALKDLFSVWKQAVKDSKTNMESSILSHQYPDKLEAMTALSARSSLPDTNALNAIFDHLKHDIEQNGKSVSYQGSVISNSGETRTSLIQRVGTFTNTSEGTFLVHDPAKNTLLQPAVQPETRLLDIIRDASYQSMHEAKTIISVIDPSQGLVLEQLALIPTWEDRFHQGGYIGYVIVSLGLIGLLLSLLRWISITLSQSAIRKQMKNPSTIDTRNPLGKIISAYERSMDLRKTERRKDDKIDNETLEVELQEIVMTEMPKLDKGLGTLKLLAAIAPLLGLLGTVVGMINTFQSITLVGNADPKLMAGGISQALMTTVMGLLVAVPLLFSHNYLSAKTKRTIMFLTQQSLGFIVKYMHDQTEANNKRPQSNEDLTKESQ